MKKIKLSHIITELGPGGMENGIINLCNNHDRNIFELHVCCLIKKGEFANRLKKDVRLESLNLSGVGITKSILKLRQYFLTMKIDIVHTHGLAGGSLVGIIAAKLANVPVIINGEHGSFFTSKIQIAIQRFIYNYCNINLSVSEALKMELIKRIGLKSNSITVIHNGVDLSYFSDKNDSAPILKYIKDNYGVDLSNKFVIGCIGSLKPEKNQQLLIEAVNKLTKSYDDTNNIVVLIIGDGPDRKYLLEFTEKKDLNSNILFLGLRNDINMLLSIINLVVSVSISEHEGLSNVILESMASSVPVISTKSIGSVEIVIDNFNGYLLDSHNLNLLSQKIYYLFKNKNKLIELSVNSREFVSKNFSLKQMVKNYELIYFNLAMKYLKN
ncbi:glycosyltransferase [Desulfatiferula olefinivorans]